MLAHRLCKVHADNHGSLDSYKANAMVQIFTSPMNVTVCDTTLMHSPVHVHTSKEAFLGYIGNSFNEVLHMCVIVLLHANKGVLILTQKPPNLALAQQALYMLPDLNIYGSVCLYVLLGEILDG